MAIINNVNEVLHRIRVKLYPNYLPHVEGAYIARTNNEATLGIEEICAALKNRGGFTGNYEDLVEYVKQFFDEAAYQLCDGFAIHTGYYSIHPNVGGTFNNANSSRDREKHPVNFRFRARAPLLNLAQNIVVDIEGLADAQAYIDEFIDIETGAINETLTPGGQFSVSGHKIRVAGDDPLCGLYFISEADGNNQHKASSHFAENVSNKIIGVIPALQAGVWKLEIRTQFTGSGSSSLKNLRVIQAAFSLTVS